jgi:hypothetical protein
MEKIRTHKEIKFYHFTSRAIMLSCYLDSPLNFITLRLPVPVCRQTGLR